MKFEELSDSMDSKEVEIENTKIQESCFDYEKELVEYVVDNIDVFAKQILNDEIISFEVEKLVGKKRRYGKTKAIDLFINGAKSIYIIEFKNPKFPTENREAIGQILNYGREFSDSKKELIIITTYFDLDTAKTISYYNLPIRYIYLSKKHIIEYRGD